MGWVGVNVYYPPLIATKSICKVGDVEPTRCVRVSVERKSNLLISYSILTVSGNTCIRMSVG